MVKIEGFNGEVWHVIPGPGMALRYSGAGLTTVCLPGVPSFTVPSTPDEVHARLFPGSEAERDHERHKAVNAEWQRKYSPTSLSHEARAVLEHVAKSEGGLISAATCALARKALGRDPREPTNPPPADPVFAEESALYGTAWQSIAQRQGEMETQDEEWGVPKRPFEADPNLTGMNSVALGIPSQAETTARGALERARDACGEATAALLELLPPEESKRLAEALDAANVAPILGIVEETRRFPERVAKTVDLLAFAVRRLSGREG